MKKKKKKKSGFSFREFIYIILFITAAYFILRFPFFIQLNGQRNLTIEVGQTYVDAGAYHLLGFKVKALGCVDTNTLGTYRITYTSILQRATRTVKVADTTAPQVTLNGRKTVYISLNGIFNDEGVSAIDNYDGDISYKTVVEGEADLSACGQYQLRYSVTDSSGNVAEAVREVIVLDDDFNYLSAIKDGDELSKTAKNAITALVDDYAFCTKYLQYTTDQTLIKNDSQRYLYQSLTNAVVDMRSQMPLDLTINDIDITLKIEQIQNEGNNTCVYATETDTLTYNYNPSLCNINCYLCIFELNSRNEIVDFYREEGCFYNLYDDYRDDQNYKTEIDKAVKEYVLQWLNNRIQAIAMLEQLNSGAISYRSLSNKKATYTYNRIKATAYAEKYALKQNPDYFYINENNCVNFVSQCLHSSGIPMVDDGNNVWKNYDYDVNNDDGAYGFSYSWTATGYFMRFATNSKDVIIQTHVSPFLSEAGDVIMFGTNESDLSHATVCSKVIKDESGNVVDVLFCGNTNHTLNCSLMASSALYCECEKVLGYN